jgi:hypothetical protein
MIWKGGANMFRKVSATFLILIPILTAFTVGAEERMPNRLVVETLVDRINYSPWMKNSFKLSQDRKHIAYVAEDGGRMVVVVDGKKGKLYDAILPGTPIFSPDGVSVAYAAKQGNRWFVVSDGKEGKRYDAILEDSIIFSKDDIHLAYAARSSSASFVVLDGKEGIQYSGNTLVEPDSIVIDSPDSLHYLVVEGSDVYYVKEKID